jgi:phosphate binding protein
MEGEAMAGMALPEVNPLEVTGDVISAGSSTVFPLAEAIAERFIDEGYGGNITIDSIGSGAGFERFCTAGETDVSNASRAIRDSEIENCRAIDREPIEFRIGTDAMAVVVNPGNDWLADGVTMEELAKIFSNEASTWADVNPAWPAQEIKRFAPGTDSGTYDFFVEEVMEPVYGETAEEAFLGAANLQLSEDDNVLVQGVAGDTNGIGFFGFAYFQENQDRINALSLNGVAPTSESVDAGEYPLARPLFMYSDAGIMNGKPQVAAYLNFVLSNVDEVISEVGYFPASEDALNASKQAWLDAMGQ